MSERELENAEAAEKALAEAKALAENPVVTETVSLKTGKSRKKRNLNLSKDEKRQIRYLRTADRVGIVFGDDSIRVSRADSIRLVEKRKAKVVVNMSEGWIYCTVHPRG